MATAPGGGAAGGGFGHLRASTADRERAVDVLKAAFAEGRLTKEEFDQRVNQAHASRTYADLAALTREMQGAGERMWANVQKGDWAGRSIDELAPQTFPAWR